MASIDLVYTFTQTKADFNQQLVYLGTTYYEGYEIYEHVDFTNKHLFGLRVNRIELCFLKDNLIGISFYLLVKSFSDEEVVHLIEEAVYKKPLLIDREVISLTLSNKVHKWEYGNNYLGLLNDLERDQLFIHYANKDSTLFW